MWVAPLERILVPQKHFVFEGLFLIIGGMEMNMYRTHNCDELRKDNVGQQVRTSRMD